VTEEVNIGIKNLS